MNRSVSLGLTVFLTLSFGSANAFGWHRPWSRFAADPCESECAECVDQITGEMLGSEPCFESAQQPAFESNAYNSTACDPAADSFTSAAYQRLPAKSLFNGVDLTGWTNLEKTGPATGWGVENGMICHSGDGGNLYSVDAFDNFILDFEFKLDHGTNSGVKYKTWRGDGWGMGCEYQVFDDASAPDQAPRYKTASLYDVYAPYSPDGLLKRDEFNHGRIVVMGNYVEHWLNGVRTVATRIDSAPWKKRVASSKFADEPNFGHIESSPIFLQDHGTPVWFRNITITELKPIAL